MTYLEWKKRILLYWIARARKVEAIPESLDFLIYTHFKSVSPNSLPGAMTLILPAAKLSIERAVDCIAAAIGLDTQMPIQVQEITPAETQSAPVIKDMAPIEISSSAVGSTPVSGPMPKSILHVENPSTSIQVVEPELQLLKFSALGLQSGLVAVACLMPRGSVEYTRLGYKALLATEIIARQYVPFLAVSDINLEQGIGIKLAIDRALLEELTAGVEVKYSSVISTALERAEPLMANAVLTGRTNTQITATLSRTPATELIAGISLALDSRIAIQVNGNDFGKLVVDVLLRLDKTVDVKPAEVAIYDLPAEISDYVDYDMGVDLNSLIPGETGTEFAAPKEEYFIAPSCANLNAAALDAGLCVETTAKAVCVKRLYIADYAGVTIDTLEVNSIESLAFSEIDYKNK